jgi:hypothetical protein
MRAIKFGMVLGWLLSTECAVLAAPCDMAYHCKKTEEGWVCHAQCDGDCGDKDDKHNKPPIWRKKSDGHCEPVAYGCVCYAPMPWTGGAHEQPREAQKCDCTIQGDTSVGKGLKPEADKDGVLKKYTFRPQQDDYYSDKECTAGHSAPTHVVLGRDQNNNLTPFVLPGKP